MPVEFTVGMRLVNSAGGFDRVIEHIDGDRIGYRVVAGAKTEPKVNLLCWTTHKRLRWWVKREASGSTEPIIRGRGFNKVVEHAGFVELILTDSRGLEMARTKVSAVDLPKLQEVGRRWYANRRTANSGQYVETRLSGPGPRVLGLARLVLDAPDGMFVDHINGDTLDNRRENLRVVTPSQNSQNRPADRDSSTGVKNVCWDKSTKRFRTYLMIKGKNHNLGYYDTLEEAAEVVRKARLTMHTHSPDHGPGRTA